MAPTDFAYLIHSSPSTSSYSDGRTRSSGSSSPSPCTPATSVVSCPSRPICPPPQHIASISGQIHLPAHLPRPSVCCGVDGDDDAASAAAGSTSTLGLDTRLRNIPRQYIVDRLARSGFQLLHAINDTEVAALSSSSLSPSNDNTPSTSYFVRSSCCLAAPDTILAISGPSLDDLVLQPVHGLVLALHCGVFSELGGSAILPEMDQNTIHISRMIDQQDDGGDDCIRRIPAVKITLPDAPSIATLKEILLPYFYTQDSTFLFTHLLPLSSLPCASSSTLLLEETRSILSTKLSTLPVRVLMCNLHKIYKTWQVAVSLRASSDKLWKILQLAWAVNVAALVIKAHRERPEGLGA